MFKPILTSDSVSLVMEEPVDVPRIFTDDKKLSQILRNFVSNALKLCEVAGRDDIPVYAGAVTPLLHEAPHAAFVHGDDGFGDTGYVPSPRTAVMRESSG